MLNKYIESMLYSWLEYNFTVTLVTIEKYLKFTNSNIYFLFESLLESEYIIEKLNSVNSLRVLTLLYIDLGLIPK